MVEQNLSSDADDLQATASDRRFSGLARLYGVAGASRIENAHVAVVGLGGVGSWSAEALARSGVRRLTLIDLDHVSESNINRQIHAIEASLGQSKVLAMQDRTEDARIHCGEAAYCVSGSSTTNDAPPPGRASQRTVPP